MKIHFVEFIVELLSKLPGQVIMAERSQRKGLTLTDSLRYLSVCLDSHWKLLPEVGFYDRRKVFAAADEVLKNIMQCSTYPSMSGVSDISFRAVAMYESLALMRPQELAHSAKKATGKTVDSIS